MKPLGQAVGLLFLGNINTLWQLKFVWRKKKIMVQIKDIPENLEFSNIADYKNWKS